MRRLNHPVYRNRVLQVARRRGRSSRWPSTWPSGCASSTSRAASRTATTTCCASSIGFVVVGKLDRLRRLRPLPEVVALRQRPRLPADRPRRRRRQRDPGRRLHRRCKPFADTLPRSVAVIDFLLTLILIAGARLAVRLIVERPAPRRPRAQARGAGRRRRLRRPDGRPRAAAQPATSAPTAIGFVDDDPRKRGMRMLGLKVLGSTKRDRRDPRRDRARRGRDRDPLGAGRRCAARSSPPAASARSASAPCRPSSSCCAAASSSTGSCARSRSRTCSAASRSCCELDRVGAYLRDRIVLVTGAGGSIGSELCRQIARVEPRLLVMLDHAEDNLFQIDREMVEERHFTSVESVLADCKEPRPDARGDAALQARASSSTPPPTSTCR